MKTSYDVSPDGVIEKVETPDPIVTVIDPASVNAEIVNLQMNLEEQIMLAKRATDTQAEIQAKIDALKSLLEVPEVKAAIEAATLKETPIDPQPASLAQPALAQ